MSRKEKTKSVSQLKRESFWERNEASNGILLQETLKKQLLALFRTIILFGMCFMIIQPLLNKIAISFMEERDLYDSTIVTIPKHFSVSNWKYALLMLDYKTTLFNSFWVSILVSVIQVFVCALVGYGFSRFQFPLKRLWFFCVILIILIPPQTISSSLYTHFRYFKLFGLELNLSSSMVPYILMCCTCMGLKNGLYIFMIRQYFQGFPFELEEAAYVDGCNSFTTFIKIMLPGAKPILTSCFLFSFVWQWTDQFYTKLFLGKIKLLSMYVGSIVEKFGNYMSNNFKYAVTIGYSNAITATGVLLTLIPLLIIYIFAQNLFVESLTASGMKE